MMCFVCGFRLSACDDDGRDNCNHSTGVYSRPGSDRHTYHDITYAYTISGDKSFLQVQLTAFTINPSVCVCMCECVCMCMSINDDDSDCGVRHI